MSFLRAGPAFAVTFSIYQARPVRLFVSKPTAALLIYYVSSSCHSVLNETLQKKIHPLASSRLSARMKQTNKNQTDLHYF